MLTKKASLHFYLKSVNSNIILNVYTLNVITFKNSNQNELL